MIDKFKKLIDQSRSILITTHLGADPDAVCSGLLLLKTLQLNYPDKKISFIIEEVSYGLDFINGFKLIKKSPLSKAFSRFEPELLIILDANHLERCTRDIDAAGKALNNSKVAIVDHHEPHDKSESDVYIHQNSPAVTQDVYDICYDQLNLKKPEGYAEIAMAGIYSDTAGFVHLTEDYQKTFKIVIELIKNGASIEQTHNQLNQFTAASLEVLSSLLSNSGSYEHFTYSYLDDAYIDSKPINDIKQGIDIYTNSYIRNIDGRVSGFVVYRDQNGQPNEYKVSFRSLPEVVNVADIAKKLGGGGHKPAAGASFAADSVNDAIAKVKNAISENC